MIVSSSQTPWGYSYTVRRGGRQWTVTIPEQEFKGSQDQRRATLTARLQEAMRGPADE